MGGYFIFRRDLFWVSGEEGKGVTGYICGEINGFGVRVVKMIVLLPVVVFFFILEAPFFTKKGWGFLFKLLKSFLLGELRNSSREKLERFPAHLHINIAPGLQDKGLGSDLMAVFLRELELRKIKGVHLRLYGDEEGGAAYRFFKKFFFREAERRKVTFFPKEESKNRFLITMVREIEGE